jgi:hypothetical protein
MENGGWSLLSIYIYIYVFLCPGWFTHLFS